MDIKDSYLHGTVGVVKSISVTADKLSYKLADVAGTTKTVTLPVATQSANGLMSSTDKTKLDNLSSTLGNYVTLNTDQEITGIKTFTKQLKFIIAEGTSPFLVTSTTKVDNLNSDLLDGKHDGELTAKYLKSLGRLPTASNIHGDGLLRYYHSSASMITDKPKNDGFILHSSWDSLKDGGYETLLFLSVDTDTVQYRRAHQGTWKPWKTLAFTDSNITGNASSATKLQTKRKLWGLDFDGTADVSGAISDVTNINNIINLTSSGNIIIGTSNVEQGRLKIIGPSDNSDIMYLCNWAGNAVLDVLSNGNVLIGTTTDDGHKLQVNGNIKATSFLGNIDGTYVNALTGYTKATSAADLAATDTLNIALGKLEYKAAVAYSWYRSITEDDTDDIINKWDEVVDFVNNMSNDLTDEFVTRKTALTITGDKVFSGTGASLLTIDRHSDNPAWIKFAKNGTLLGYIGINKDLLPVFLSGESGASNKTLIHSGNYTLYLPYLNSSSTHATNTSVIYAPTTAGTSGLMLISNGSGAPSWVNNDSITIGNASKVTVTLDITSDNTYPVIWCKASNTENTQASLYKAYNQLTYNPKTDTLKASNFSGNASTATRLKGSKLNNDTDLNTILEEGFYHLEDSNKIKTFINKPETPTDGEIRLEVKWCGSKSYLYLFYYYKDVRNLHGIYYRFLYGTTWSEWYLLVNSNNYNLFSPKLDGTGATGTWNIGLKGKVITSAEELDTLIDKTFLVAYLLNSVIEGFSDGIILSTGVVGIYGHLIYLDDNNESFKHRSRNGTGTAWYSWRTILDSYNYTSYTVKKDGTGATGTWGISITGNAGSASTSAKLSSISVISAKAFSLSNVSWIDTGYTFESLTSGTYAVQVTCGNLVASGIMSVYKNIDDTAGDEIPLHVYHDSTQPWRPYLRTSGKKLLISSNDGSATSRTVTIKIALIL